MLPVCAAERAHDPFTDSLPAGWHHVAALTHLLRHRVSAGQWRARYAQERCPAPGICPGRILCQLPVMMGGSALGPGKGVSGCSGVSTGSAAQWLLACVHQLQASCTPVWPVRGTPGTELLATTSAPFCPVLSPRYPASCGPARDPSARCPVQQDGGSSTRRGAVHCSTRVTQGETRCLAPAANAYPARVLHGEAWRGVNKRLLEKKARGS